jgi:hypothetical protein
MNSPEPNQQLSDKSITIDIKSSFRNQLVARTVLVILFSGALGIFYAQDATEKYQKGTELTQEKYVKNFDRYKSSLMSGNAPTHPVAAIFICLIMMSFLIGSYELAALAISLIIAKVFRS